MSDTDLDRITLLDEEVIAELREVLEDEFAELLQHFLNELPLQFARLQTAIDQSDAGELYRVAHQLKSSCGSMGALRLAELVRRLERAGRESTLDDATALLDRTRAVSAETVTGLRAHLN